MGEERLGMSNPLEIARQYREACFLESVVQVFFRTNDFHHIDNIFRRVSIMFDGCREKIRILYHLVWTGGGGIYHNC